MTTGIHWIASFPKSGNTWIRTFVDHMAGGTLAPSIAETEGPWFDAFRTAFDDVNAPDYLDALGDARRRAHTELGRGSPVLKTHLPREVPGSTLGLPADAVGRAIYILRDPRDVAVSYAAHCGIDIDAAIAVINDPGHVGAHDQKNVMEYRGTWSTHVASWLGTIDPRVLVVCYEAALRHPERCFRAIARHFGLATEGDAFEAAMAASSFQTLRADEEAGRFTDKPAGVARFFRSGRAGAWRDVLTGAQRARIEADHGDVMRRLGYLKG